MMPKLDPPDPGEPKTKDVSPEVRSDGEATVLVEAVLKLFERWSLSDNEIQALLGGLTDDRLHRWKAGCIGLVSDDVSVRVAGLLRIHSALCDIFNNESMYGWVKRPNEAFGGKSALDVMMWGGLEGIYRVKDYLDAERFG